MVIHRVELTGSALLEELLGKLFSNRAETVVAFHNYDGTIVYVNDTQIPRYGGNGAIHLGTDFVGRPIQEMCGRWGQSFEDTVLSEAARIPGTCSRLTSGMWVHATALEDPNVTSSLVFATAHQDGDQDSTYTVHRQLLALMTITVAYVDAVKLSDAAGQALAAARARLAIMQEGLIALGQPIPQRSPSQHAHG